MRRKFLWLDLTDRISVIRDNLTEPISVIADKVGSLSHSAFAIIAGRNILAMIHQNRRTGFLKKGLNENI